MLRSCLVLAAALAAAAPAAAQPRPASQGPYAEAGIGGAAFVGSAANHSRVGPALGVRLGIDLFSWLSVGGTFAASTHEATVPPPPEGERYQLYAGIADARITVRVARVAIFAHGGGGFGAISSNILEKVDVLEPGQRFTPVLAAGGGAQYQLQNRHFAFGLDGTYTLYTDFDAASAVTVRGFLRYTY